MSELSKYIVKHPVENNGVVYYENEVVELDEFTGSTLVGQGIVVAVPETITTTAKTKKVKEEIQTEITQEG